jgi:hypothetical protein
MGPQRCRSCAALVYWLKTAKGARMIVDADTVTDPEAVFDARVHRAHWATCPDAVEWRAKRAREGRRACQK